jgi:hypothetical protein
MRCLFYQLYENTVSDCALRYVYSEITFEALALPTAAKLQGQCEMR